MYGNSTVTHTETTEDFSPYKEKQKHKHTHLDKSHNQQLKASSLCSSSFVISLNFSKGNQSEVMVSIWIHLIVLLPEKSNMLCIQNLPTALQLAF